MYFFHLTQDEILKLPITQYYTLIEQATNIRSYLLGSSLKTKTTLEDIEEKRELIRHFKKEQMEKSSGG